MRLVVLVFLMVIGCSPKERHSPTPATSTSAAQSGLPGFVWKIGTRKLAPIQGELSEAEIGVAGGTMHFDNSQWVCDVKAAPPSQSTEMYYATCIWVTSQRADGKEQGRAAVKGFTECSRGGPPATFSIVLEDTNHNTEDLFSLSCSPK